MERFVPPDYVYEEPKEFDFHNLDERLLFEDLVHYMKHCMGIYGPPLHLFDNLCCGLCQLSQVTWCRGNFRCRNKRYNKDIFDDDCCLCGIGTMKLQTTTNEDLILKAFFENGYCQVPFTISLDHSRQAVVLTIRGTLSVKDALTDMSASMIPVPDIPGFSSDNVAFMHKGMYDTAKWIKEKKLHKDGIDILKTIMNRQDLKGYRLVVTGHSLGAGVASILALLLKPEHPHVKAYVFSPPGCIFSFPLARYSRKFITSVVLGNDMIPRVSFRSLLYLKREIIELLEVSKKPKYQIMVQPSWSARCCGTSEEPTVELSVIHEKVLDPKPDESDDDSAAAKSSSSLPKWCCCRKRASAKKLGKKVNAGEIEAKAFPPGKIIHIKLEKSTKPWFLASCYPGQIRVSWVSPEDLCVIVLDRGIVQDHLPTSVLGAMKRCNDHFIQGHFDPLETKHRREELLRNFSSERAENGVFPAELPAGREEEPLAPLPLELEVLGNGQPARSQVDVEVSIEMEDSHV